MSRFVVIGRGGVINADDIVAIVPAKSAPVKRMLDAAHPAQVINMTYGYPRTAVIVFNNGCFALVSQTVASLAELLKVEERIADADDPVSW